MNKQIKALIEKTNLRDFLAPNQTDRAKDLEAFAQLLLEECVSICEINGTSYKHSFTPAKAKLAESTSKYCGHLIRQHFNPK